MTSPAVPDKDLAAGATGGFDLAFVQLCRQFRVPIHDFLARFTGDREEAAHLTQATFAEASQAWAARDPSAPVGPWLFGVAHRAAAGAAPPKRAVCLSEHELDVYAVPPGDGNGEGNGLAVETAQDVWLAAAQLDDNDYVALHCRLRAGFTSDEIGEAVDATPHAVDDALAAARRGFEAAFAARQIARHRRGACAELDAVLAGNGGGTLDPATVEAIERHVEQCERCRADNRSSVAPAALFAGLAPVPPVGDTEPQPAVAARPAPPPVRARTAPFWLTAGLVVVVLAACGLVLAWLARVGPDRSEPIDPADVHSTSHVPGQASPDRVVTMTWSPADDPAVPRQRSSGVRGYSVSWTSSARSEPDGTVDLGGTATSAQSPVLANGRWWFHLRTIDRAGNMTGTVHVGPFVIVAATSSAGGPSVRGTPPQQAAAPVTVVPGTATVPPRLTPLAPLPSSSSFVAFRPAGTPSPAPFVAGPPVRRAAEPPFVALPPARPRAVPPVVATTTPPAGSTATSSPPPTLAPQPSRQRPGGLRPPTEPPTTTPPTTGPPPGEPPVVVEAPPPTTLLAPIPSGDLPPSVAGPG